MAPWALLATPMVKVHHVNPEIQPSAKHCLFRVFFITVSSIDTRKGAFLSEGATAV